MGNIIEDCNLVSRIISDVNSMVSSFLEDIELCKNESSYRSYLQRVKSRQWNPEAMSDPENLVKRAERIESAKKNLDRIQMIKCNLRRGFYRTSEPLEINGIIDGRFVVLGKKLSDINEQYVNLIELHQVALKYLVGYLQSTVSLLGNIEPQLIELLKDSHGCEQTSTDCYEDLVKQYVSELLGCPVESITVERIK